MGKKLLRLLPLVMFLTVPAAAQDWSVGVATGPFVFGDFVTRTFRVGNTSPGRTVTSTLSAATRAGLRVDLERRLTGRWSVRAEGTFVHAPLSVGDDAVELDAGKIDVSTLSLPIVFHLNRGGTFRFHVFAGPAYGAYRIKRQNNAPASLAIFNGTRAEWGLEAGGGIAWMLSDRFAVEGAISDTVTGSPFREEDLSSARGVTIERPHNVHTMVGVRYRF
jgi:opacity protein-like surface antigen